MVSNTQAAHIRELIDERHSSVKREFDCLLGQIARANLDGIKSANSRLVNAINELKAAVATRHWPKWLRDLSDHCVNYQNNHNNGIATWDAHLRSVMNNYIPLFQENWTFGGNDNILFDSSEIIEKSLLDSKVNEFYDNLIKCLEELLKSGEVDSVRASSDLERIIANLKKSKEDEFFSKFINWQFVRRLIPNIIASYVRESDITGPILKAIEQTSAELDGSFEKSKEQIGSDILIAASAVLKTNCQSSIASSSIIYLGNK